MQQPNFEVPHSVREAAERSVEQTKQVTERFFDAARQSHDVLLKSTDAMSVGAREVGAKTLQFAQANAEANFAFADRLVKAKDLREVMEIQTQFARQAMEMYTAQTQELTRIIAGAAQNAQPKQP